MNDNKEEEEEWEDKIKQYQLISHVKEINFDNLLRFWLIIKNINLNYYRD